MASRRLDIGRLSNPVPTEQLSILKLRECQPNKIVAHGMAEPFPDRSSDLAYRSVAVALVPDERRRFVEAMGLVRDHVIDERLVRTSQDDKILGTGLWKVGAAHVSPLYH